MGLVLGFRLLARESKKREGERENVRERREGENVREKREGERDECCR